MLLMFLNLIALDIDKLKIKIAKNARKRNQNYFTDHLLFRNQLTI